MNFTKVILLVAACSILIIACNQEKVVNSPKNAVVSTPTAQTPVPSPVDQAAAAKELYAMNCMICHKDSGKGGKTTIEGKTINAEDLTAEKFKKATDEKLITYVTDGIPDEGMPAFIDKLTPAEIRSVIKHVRSLQK